MKTVSFPVFSALQTASDSSLTMALGKPFYDMVSLGLIVARGEVGGVKRITLGFMTKA